MRLPDFGALIEITRWETLRHFTSVDRRTIMYAVVAAIMLAGLVGATATHGVDVKQGLYQVGVSEDSEFAGPVAEASSLQRVSPDTELGTGPGQADVVIRDGRLYAADSQQGVATVTELRQAIKRYNTNQLEAEANQSAAFPVRLDLHYVEVSSAASQSNSGMPGVGGGAGSDDASNQSADDGSSEGFIDQLTDRLPTMAQPGGQSVGGTPGNITPPFPFQSLVLGLLFIVPLNFIVQSYGSSMINERLNRRGELMLVSPVSRFEIITGKTIPYFAAMLATTIGISAFIGGGIMSVAAVLPIITTFLGSVFVAAMFARSFKELTFVTISLSIGITSYAFVPAIFTNVHPIALISPLTIVVETLRNNPVSLVEYAFATGPLYLVSLILFVLGAGVYREEDMFAQRSIHRKALDALAAWTTRYRDVPVMTAALLPIAFVVELLVVAFVFILPQSIALIVLFVAVGIIEEIVKSLHVFAAYEHGSFDRGWPTALKLGALSGGGFFLAEKITAVVQTVGLTQLDVGRAAFTSAAPPVDGVLGLAFILAAPLALHTVTATISALGARKDATTYATTLSAAIAVHTVYNLTVVMLLA